MNTPTLGRFCTPRIGRADIDVASRAVDRSSRARQLCYPRSNFSVISSPHQGGHRGSLSQYFYAGLNLDINPVRRAFAFALYSGFLTQMSSPLGPDDIFSSGCHPSRTVCLSVSFLRSKQCKQRRVVLQGRLHLSRSSSFDISHLRSATQFTSQQQATVKFHGVFASHWKSLVFAPVKLFGRI